MYGVAVFHILMVESLVTLTLGNQVTDKYMSYGNTMFGGDLPNCVSTSVLSSETGRGELSVV